MSFRSGTGRFAATLLPALVLGLGGLAGCAPDLGPRAALHPMTDYAAAKTFTQPVTEWPAEDWWTAFNDPVLTSLIEQALKDSPDLKTAQARLEQASAQVQQARGAAGPNLTAKGSIQATGVKIGLPNTPSQFKDFLPTDIQWFTQVGANLNYEIDFFGKNRAAIAAASSSSRAASFELAAARLQISTAVASAYADLVQAVADHAAAVEAADLRGKSRGLVADRLKNGLETKAEYNQSDAAQASSEVDVISTEGSVLEARHALAALTGQGPDATAALNPGNMLKTTPVGLPANLTANLVGRRPDIAAARLRAEAAAQRENVARASYYPNVSLTGSFLALSTSPQDILTHNVQLAQIGPAISLPIFDSGRLNGALRNARGTYDEAVASYDKTVVDAMREVADTLIIRQGAEAALVHANDALRANEEAYRLVNMRYNAGLATYLQVLTVENSLVAARRQAADLRVKALSANVMLIRALGGGFSDVPPSAQQSNP